MLLSFVIAVYWCLVYTILGSIVLACVPSFRVTLLNVVIFVIGAWPGVYAYYYASGFLLDHAPFHIVPLEHYPVALSLVGAIIGGTLMVWLKLRFTKASDDRRLL
jgi:hypothetical protein